MKQKPSFKEVLEEAMEALEKLEKDK